MLKAGAGCAVFLALVQAENPVRSIKLPNPSIVCCMLGAINHCCAATAGEGASVPEVFWQKAVPLGLMAAVRGGGVNCSGETAALERLPCPRHGRMSLWEMRLKGLYSSTLATTFYSLAC